MADALADMRFPMGSTWYNGGTIDTSNLQGVNYEGKEYIIEDDPPTGPPTHRTYKYKRLQLVRNWSTGSVALLPKRLTNYAAGFHGRRVDSYSYLNAMPAYPVDEYLPAAGVAYGDLFYIVIEGPALCLYDLAGTTAITEGDAVMALTAATSQATSAGYVAEANFAATTTTGSLAANCQLGWAMSAVTSGNSGTGILIDIKRH